MKQSGRQAMIKAAKTIHPPVLMRCATTGAAFV
jgi:hypothetical protein